MDTVKGKRASCPTIELNTTPSVVGNPVRTYTVASFNSGSWVLFPRVTQLSDHPPTPPPPPGTYDKPLGAGHVAEEAFVKSRPRRAGCTVPQSHLSGQACMDDDWRGKAAVGVCVGC